MTTLGNGDVPRLALTVPEAAARLALGRSTVYELVLSGELPSFKVGRSRRILVADLQRWLVDQTQVGTEQ